MLERSYYQYKMVYISCTLDTLMHLVVYYLGLIVKG